MKKKQEELSHAEAFVLGVLICIFMGLSIWGIIEFMEYQSEPSDFELAEPCLEEIATDYCNGKDLDFSSIFKHRDNYIVFYCKEDARVMDSIRFIFTEEDLDKCYNECPDCEVQEHTCTHTHGVTD